MILCLVLVYQGGPPSRENPSLHSHIYHLLLYPLFVPKSHRGHDLGAVIPSLSAQAEGGSGGVGDGKMERWKEQRSMADISVRSIEQSAHAADHPPTGADPRRRG